MGKKSVKDRAMEVFDTCESFNCAEKMTIVRMDDGRFAFVHHATKLAYVEHTWKPIELPGFSSLERIVLPPLPRRYKDIPDGTETSMGNCLVKLKSIGGVSATRRIVGCPRAKARLNKPVTLFAIRMEHDGAAHRALGEYPDIVTLGDSETVDDPQYGTITELIVHNASDVDFVAARIERTCGEIIFEDNSENACQTIGIERLDRIEAAICHKDVDDERTAVEEFGLGRGDENWKFSWLPSEWTRPPITWDYMVENMTSVSDEDVPYLPVPLKQHVARYRYDRCPADAPSKRIFENILFHHGKPKNRCVSAGLSRDQVRQLLRAFYLVEVERVSDPDVVHAAHLILYHYMLHGGYTARWMGKYQQEARFIGNGDVTRNFNRLEQYRPSRLPTCVLNKLSGCDGTVKGRGGKGSRSKYVAKEKRYVPKQRITKEKRKKQRERMVQRERV